MTIQSCHCEELSDEAIPAGSALLVIVVHSLAHAIAALKAAARAGRPVALASAPGAGSYVGPGWFREIVAAARQTVPEASFSSWLDCGDDIGATLAALRSEVEGV